VKKTYASSQEQKEKREFQSRETLPVQHQYRRGEKKPISHLRPSKPPGETIRRKVQIGHLHSPQHPPQIEGEEGRWGGEGGRILNPLGGKKGRAARLYTRGKEEKRDELFWKG